MTDPQLPEIGDSKPVFTATPRVERKPHPSPITEAAIQRARGLTGYITDQMVLATLRGDLKLARALNQIR